MEGKWGSEIKSQALYRLDESSRMALSCMAELSDSEIWLRPNAASNSVGNLVLHLCGNMRQYVIASLGESKDTRNRELEFTTTSGYSRAQLAEKLSDTIDLVKETIAACTHQQLLKKRKVQGFDLTGVGIIIHVVEHLSYHTGQMAFWVKLLKDKDLGFYDGTDLNTLNEP